MGIHRPHPGDVHEHGLYDGCGGCEEIAANPFATADRRMLTRFMVEATQNPRRIPDGDNEAVAVKNVLNALEHAGKLAETSPMLLGRYLHDRWRVDLDALGRIG